MRLLQFLTWLLPSTLAAANSISPQLLLFDSEITSRHLLELSLDASTARMILADRLELSQFYTLRDFGTDQIAHIDKLRGPKRTIFGDDTAARRSKVLVIVEDVDSDLMQRVGDISSSNAFVNERPSENEILRLVESLRMKASSLGRVDGDRDYAHVSSLNGLVGAKVTTEGGRTIMRVNSLPQIHGETNYDSIISLIKELSTSTDAHISSILLLPPYLTVNKRSVSGWSLSAREEILSSSDPSSTQVTSNPPMSARLASASEAIPSHFANIDDCMRDTSNCTSHGTCDVVAVEDQPDHQIKFYGCVCKPQKKQTSGGRVSTTYYGGNACEKMDMSAPFWLLAGVTVGLVTVISMGIGLLYSMGAEDLPSVIGAGVSSSRK